MGFIIETPLSPHMAGRSTGLIARLFFFAIWRVEHRGVKRGDKVQVLFPRANTIQSVPRRFSVFFPSCLRHVSRGRTWRPRASADHSLLCRFSVFIPSCLRHASRGRTWRSQASTDHSLPRRFTQSVLCFPLNPRANITHSALCRLSQNPPLRT